MSLRGIVIETLLLVYESGAFVTPNNL